MQNDDNVDNDDDDDDDNDHHIHVDGNEHSARTNGSALHAVLLWTMLPLYTFDRIIILLAMKYDYNVKT